MGAPYIYDISRLRVKVLRLLKMAAEKREKKFFYSYNKRPQLSL